jgi:uncharacterized membrane protein
MKRTISTLLFFTATMSLAACASGGSDVDSESHFQCTSDDDCRSAGEGRVCVAGSCALPGGQSDDVDQSAGPLVDCTTQWPADAASFETTAGRLPAFQVGWGGPRPRLNRNGTVIVADVLTHYSATGLIPVPNGHLIRWAGDTVARLGQPADALISADAVSCDGAVVVGASQGFDRVAYRWSASERFSRLPGTSTPGSDDHYQPSALSADGSTTWGSHYSYTPAFANAVRWNDNLIEGEFTLPDSTSPLPGWSRDGSTFAGTTTTGEQFVQSANAPATFLNIPSVDEYTAKITAISFDGRVVAGTRPFSSEDLQVQHRGYLWIDGTAHDLPEGTEVFAVSPDGVAVGPSQWPTPPFDGDFVWDRAHGPRRLRDILADHGVLVPRGVHILASWDISADSRVITGVCEVEGSPTPMDLFRAVIPAGAFD